MQQKGVASTTDQRVQFDRWLKDFDSRMDAFTSRQDAFLDKLGVGRNGGGTQVDKRRKA